MSQYVQEIGGIEIEALTEDSGGFGDSWEEVLATGLKKVGGLTIKGIYDDTATTGPNVIWNAAGNTTSRTLKVTWGGSKTTSVETIITKYVRAPQRGALTKFEVTLAATGAVTEV